MKIIYCISFVGIFTAFQSQNQLTNQGNFTIHNGASVSVYGDFINNGMVVDSGQVVTFKGSTAQQIGGSSVTTFKNLTLNNSAGAYLSSSQALQRELTISAGTFSTTGFDFTLLSNANGTARIAPILGNFSGNITMQRYLGPAPTSWRFLASPVTGATINDWQDDFITTGFPNSSYPNFSFVSIYGYDETVGGTSDNGYVAATDATNPLVTGTGYWTYIGPTPITVDVTGPPVKFNQTFSVSYSSSAGALDDGYVMIGNPYPSPIDWSSNAWTKTNINNAIYIWNPALQQYASWVTGVATNGGSNLIASSQSFWVQTNGSNPALSCTENIKVSNDALFIKPAANDFNILKLLLSGNGFKDEAILRFGNNATNNYDSELDAWKLFSSSAQVPGLATRDSSDHDLSVNSLPPLTTAVHIPVKTVVGVTGSYTIAIDSISDLPEDVCVILEDLVTGIYTNLSAGSVYAFDITDTTQAPRFVIHMAPAHKAEAVSASCNLYTDGKGIASAKGLGPWNYKWYNSVNAQIGQSIYSFLPDTISNLAAGVYSVQITDANGACGSSVKTITVTAPLPVIAQFTFLRDTIFAGISDSLTIANTSSGALSYNWDLGKGTGSDSSATPLSQHYDLPGTYKVRLEAISYGCTDTLSRIFTVLPPNLTALNEQNTSNNVSVYPNPGTGMFYISVSKLNAADRIDIFMPSGQMIVSQSLLANKTEIDMKESAKGVYLYRILLNTQTIYGKLIVN